MIRVYIAAGVLAAVLFAYGAGVRFGRADCAGDAAVASAGAASTMMQQIGEINATVFNTGMRDIRRVLREEYTIAE